MENRLKNVLPKNDSRTDINLKILKDKFIFQLLKNNPNLIRRRSNPGPSLTATIARNWGNEKIFHGKDTFGNTTIHFDLKFPAPFSANSPKFTKLYNGDIFMLLETPGAPNTYYVKVIEEGAGSFYNFDALDMDDSLDFKALATLPYRLISSADISGTRLSQKPEGYKLEVGEIIAAYNKRDASANKLTLFTITHKKELSSGETIYGLNKKADVPLTKETSSQELRKKAALFLNERTGSVQVVKSIEEYKKSLTKRGTFLLTNEKGDGYTNLIPEVKPDLNEQGQARLLRSITQVIESLPKSGIFIVDAEILSPLEAYPEMRRAVAYALYNTTGFKDKSYRVDSGYNTFFAEALKRVDFGVFNLEKYVKVTFNTETLDHSIEAAGVLKQVNAGDIIYAGEDSYFYVTRNEQGTITALNFPSPVFNALPNESPSLQEFIEIYNKTMGC